MPARFKLVVRYWLNDSHVFRYVIVAILVSVGQSRRERETERVCSCVCVCAREKGRRSRERGKQADRVRKLDDPKMGERKERDDRDIELGKCESNIEEG